MLLTFNVQNTQYSVYTQVMIMYNTAMYGENVQDGHVRWLHNTVMYS